MAREFTNNAVQTVNPGETIIFTESDNMPCGQSLVRHRGGTGTFLIAGRVNRRRCGCIPRTANYMVDFGANIAIPTGGTVSPISLAITLDGATMPTTEMIVTPAAVEQYFNVSDATIAQIWAGCCETLSVRNTSDQPILVQNANIVFARSDGYQM